MTLFSHWPRKDVVGLGPSGLRGVPRRGVCSDVTPPSPSPGDLPVGVDGGSGVVATCTNIVSIAAITDFRLFWLTLTGFKHTLKEFAGRTTSAKRARKCVHVHGAQKSTLIPAIL